MYNRCEMEIDAIRLKQYEETKHLTGEERDMEIRTRGHKLAEQYGFTIIPSANREAEAVNS